MGILIIFHYQRLSCFWFIITRARCSLQMFSSLDTDRHCFTVTLCGDKVATWTTWSVNSGIFSSSLRFKVSFRRARSDSRTRNVVRARRRSLGFNFGLSLGTHCICCVWKATLVTDITTWAIFRASRFRFAASSVWEAVCRSSTLSLFS